MLAVGRIAAQNLLQTDAPLARLRQQVHSFGASRVPLVVTYHPAYLLRTPARQAQGVGGSEIRARGVCPCPALSASANCRRADIRPDARTGHSRDRGDRAGRLSVPLERRDFSRLPAGGLRVPGGRGGWRHGGIRHHVGGRRRGAYPQCLHSRGIPLPRASPARFSCTSWIGHGPRGCTRPSSRFGPRIPRPSRLYRSLGFEQVGVRKGYYQAAAGREDAAVLRRILIADTKQ